jgi:hypothetical protein
LLTVHNRADSKKRDPSGFELGRPSRSDANTKPRQQTKSTSRQRIGFQSVLSFALGFHRPHHEGFQALEQTFRLVIDESRFNPSPAGVCFALCACFSSFSRDHKKKRAAVLNSIAFSPFCTARNVHLFVFINDLSPVTLQNKVLSHI